MGKTTNKLLALLMVMSSVLPVCLFGEDTEHRLIPDKRPELDDVQHTNEAANFRSQTYRFHVGASKYTLVTGKSADYTNLVESLRSPHAIERFRSEGDSRLTPEMRQQRRLVSNSEEGLVINLTLSVLDASDHAYPELTNEIARCYRQSEEWRIRFLCAKVLERSGSTPDTHVFVRDLLERINLLKHVAYRTAEGQELESALSTTEMLYYDHQSPEMTNAIHRCYQANGDLGIRQRCRSAMERYDKIAAERFRREEMRHPDMDLDNRILLAKEFLEKDDPYGYQVLSEGLVRQDGAYALASALIEGFRKFDGKPYDETGKRIDIKTLIREAAITNELAVCEFRKQHVKSMKTSDTDHAQARKSGIGMIDWDVALWLRVAYARVFLEEDGWLFGYTILREGLASRDEYTRTKAVELLNLFRRHDGQAYDDEGHVINIQALLREVETAKRAEALQEPATNRINLLRGILISDKDYSEKERAVQSLGTMQSQAAASVLLDNLMSVRSGVRKGPQMRPVIGMYPCAIALVENGTNSVPPVIGFLQRTESEEARHVGMEVLKCIQRGVGATELIQKRLRSKMAKEERVRLETTLEYLQQNGSGESER